MTTPQPHTNKTGNSRRIWLNSLMISALLGLLTAAPALIMHRTFDTTRVLILYALIVAIGTPLYAAILFWRNKSKKRTNDKISI